MLPIKSGMTEEQMCEREKLWSRIESVSDKYASENGLGEKKREELKFLLHTVICGTVILFEGMETHEYEEKTALMRKELERIIAL